MPGLGEVRSPVPGKFSEAYGQKVASRRLHLGHDLGVVMKVIALPILLFGLQHT